MSSEMLHNLKETEHGVCPYEVKKLSMVGQNLRSLTPDPQI